MMMSRIEKLRRRIERQGQYLAELERDRAAEELPDPDEDWHLGLYEEWGRNGHFKDEPDFPVALEFFRDALTRAHASTEPPWEPPPDFMRDSTPQRRREDWRAGYDSAGFLVTGPRFPDVRAGYTWVSEIAQRAYEGIPAVTEAEFRELAEWFAANGARLFQNCESIDLGGDRRVDSTNIRYALAQGPRASGAGKLAEEIRTLKRRDTGDFQPPRRLREVDRTLGNEVRNLPDEELIRIIERGRASRG